MTSCVIQPILFIFNLESKYYFTNIIKMSSFRDFRNRLVISSRQFFFFFCLVTLGLDNRPENVKKSSYNIKSDYHIALRLNDFSNLASNGKN